MKTKILVIVIVLGILASLTACGKFTCDFCGEEKSGRRYTNELLEEMQMCGECYDEIQDTFGIN